jgi:hypothetical protein
MWLLPQLAVFAAAAVITAHGLAVLVVFRLAGDTEPDTRNRLAPRGRNLASAVLAVSKALAVRQFAASAPDGVLDCSVDLLLDRTVFRKSTRHCLNLDKTPSGQL